MEKKQIIEIIKRCSFVKKNLIVAIDGKCASGKSTFAKEIKEAIDCQVVSMDDFFLQAYQRTPKRYSIAGENIDHERFLSEVLKPLCIGKDATYRPFDFHRNSYGEPIKLSANKITVVEGSYSCNKHLIEYYDFKVFFDIDDSEQQRRIEKRNGTEALKMFNAKWIPLEEKYFNECRIKEKCDIIYKSEVEK